MVSGIAAGGIDLDSIFSTKGTSTAAATGIKVAGTDLNQRYLALSQGVAVPATGIKAFGADLNTYFGRVGALIIGFGFYSMVSTDTHDAGSTFTLTFNTDGTWTIAMVALHGGAISGTPTSGNWVSNPGAGVGSGYELMLDSSAMSITNSYVPADQVSPYFTASTGWLSLGSARQVIADTSHMIAGGAGAGQIIVQGTFKIYIRPAGSGSGVLSQCGVHVEGNAL